MQDLETILTKIASDRKLKDLENQMVSILEVKTGQQAAINLAWTDKWNTITQNIENNQIKIDNLTAQTDNESAEEEEENQEEPEPVPNSVDGYFKKFF